MWLSPNLISEGTSNSKKVHQIPIFLQIIKTVKMIKIMKISQTMKRKVTNYWANKYMLKVNYRKKFWCLYDKLWTYFAPFVLVFSMSILNMWLFTGKVFSTTNIKDFMVIFLPSFLKNDCFLKNFFPRFKSHFRLVEMTLKSITFVQNHKGI